MTETTHPPQTSIPDDLVPNRTGYSNEQLAIRTLAELVASLITHEAIIGHADEQLARTKALNEVFALTEPGE